VGPPSTPPYPVPAAEPYAYAPPRDVVPGAARHGAGSRRTRLWAWWSGGVLVVGGVIAVAVMIIPRAVPVVSEQLTQSRVLAAGYTTFTGPRGLTPPAGSPWGTPCAPVLFVVPASAGPELQAALVQVVGEGRRGGLNVGVEQENGAWDPQSLLRPPPTGTPPVFVPVSLDDGTPQTTPDGTLETVVFGYDAATSSDGLHEYLTRLRPRLYTSSIEGDPLIERQALRAIVAWSQGISSSSLHGTGIAWHLRGSADTFTSSDLAAMRTMSGCD